MEATEKQNLLPGIKDEKMRLSSEQMITSFIIMLPLIPVGMSLAFISIILPQINLSLAETSVLASIASAVSLFAHVLTSTLVDRWGRSTMAIISSTVLIIACTLLSTSSSFIGLCIGEALVGITSGSAILPLSVYVTESIVSHHLYTRNSISSCSMLALAVGIGICYTANGIFDNYRQVTSMCAILTTVSLLLYSIFIPESPTWLRIKGRKIEARLARNRLSFNRKVSTPYTSADDNLNREHHHETIYDHIRKIKRPDVYKPLAIAITLGFLHQFAGTQIYLSYLDSLISTTYLPIESNRFQMIAGIMPIFGVISYNLIVPYTGMKKFYLFSVFGYTIAIFLIGFTEYLNSNFNKYSYTIDYVHIAAVCLYTYETGSGPGTVQFSIVTEIFPKDAKGFGSIVYFFITLFLWFMIIIYPYAKAYFQYQIYFVWTFFSLITIPFIAYFIPETVGKTLQEISQGFS